MNKECSRKNRIRVIIWTVIILVTSVTFGVQVIQAGETKYTCPMHPHYISDHFGSCPICGMDLVEVEAGTASMGGSAEEEISIPKYMIQHAGVRSKKAEIAYFGRSIRSFGEVVVNQRLQTDVSLRVGGWIEELLVNAEGDEVRPDSIIFRFYSPQLVSAQQDYLAALSSGNMPRIRVTEDRLRSLGLQKRVIRQIGNSEKILRNVPYYAGQSGRVENISIRQGSYLKPGSIAMRIQGYDKVWVQVNLAEQDISFVDKNSRVDVYFPNLGIHREMVTIDYIAPTVEQTTRTAQLRLVLDNSDETIRPGAYADVTIMTEITPRLAIPYGCILRNKEGNYVIVDLGNGKFQAREVKPGIQHKGLIEVKAGLIEGDLVVVSGQFLIDSESSLRESFQRMEKLALSLADLDVSEHQLVLINHMVEGVMYVHEELAAGRQPQPQMLEAAIQSAQKLDHEVQGTRLMYIIDDFLSAFEGYSQIMTKSRWQELLAVSVDALVPWIVEGRPRYYESLGLALFVTDDGSYWVQFDGEMLNPYDSGKARKIALNGNSAHTAERH